jgi:hypothetical protein
MYCVEFKFSIGFYCTFECNMMYLYYRREHNIRLNLFNRTSRIKKKKSAQSRRSSQLLRNSNLKIICEWINK